MVPSVFVCVVCYVCTRVVWNILHVFAYGVRDVFICAVRSVFLCGVCCAFDVICDAFVQ